MSLSLTFSAKKKDANTDKLTINWQNFARVRLQLKFAFVIRPYDLSKESNLGLRIVRNHYNNTTPYSPVELLA